MDGEGLRKVNQALEGVGEVISKLVEGESRRFFSVEARTGFLNDPSDINEALERAGMMAHEGYGVIPSAPGPLLKYLGSNSSFHAFEDVVSQ